jgi:riboflavin synthase
MFADVAIGASVAVNGCCLTVVEVRGGVASFDAVPETMARTNLGACSAGSEVNLERSLRAGDELGGHFVTGHIDCVVGLRQREDGPKWSTFWFELPPEYAGQIVSKGSVALDGVSLTVADTGVQMFSIALIPHTLAVTTLGRKQPGDRVNLETDVLAKYIQRQLDERFRPSPR